MIVNLNNKVYLVQFTHINEQKQKVSKLSSDTKGEYRPLIRHTECKILTPIEDTEMPGFISIGYAKCHPNDNFDKERGRQISLSKALEDAEFSKEERKVFWDIYKNWGTQRF